MKEISADFLRQEVARLGDLVVETAVYHESGMKLFSAGDTVTLAHAKALHASGIVNLLLLESEEAARNVRKTPGVLLSISDDPLRIFITNALQSEGHEVIERPTSADAVEAAKRENRVTVIILDLEEALPVLSKLRDESGVRDAAIVVCAKEGKQAQL